MGGTTGDAIAWIHLRSTEQRFLTSEVGLRPDTDMLMVVVEKLQYKINRWNGFKFVEKSAWDNSSKVIPNDAGESLNLDLDGQKLSVAIFHVSFLTKYVKKF